jgi:hypothetical protein
MRGRHQNGERTVADWTRASPHHWENGNRRIHQVENRFVSQDGAGYLPGSYASFDAAVEAFGFPRRFLEELQAIQDEAAGGKGGGVSLEDLQSTRELTERYRPEAIP